MTDTSETGRIERSYLGCLLEAINKGKADIRLQNDDFENKDYGRIYKTILEQWKSGKGKTPTLLTLGDDLPDISDVIGEISSISDANIGYYENKIFEGSKTRHFAKALKIAQESLDKGIATDTVIKNFLPSVEAVTAARNEAGIKSAAELLNTDFPPIRWIVPGLIGEGLTLIVGAPKIGKSWLVLNLAIAAAAGGGFLGTLKANRTDTLYLALEDTERRIHGRLKKLNAPELDGLKITAQWRDGYMGLENYLKANKEIGLVIIDTLARFANIEDFNDYSLTTAPMARIKKIADDLGIAIVLIHHAKKTGRKNSGADWMESALGSTGLTGATDSTIFISRHRTEERTENTATLYATGRDAADKRENLTLNLDCGGWTITNKQQSPNPNKTNQPQGDKPRYG